MTECCGLMGKIFGHCFKTFIYNKPVIVGWKVTNGNSEEVKETQDTYEIRCKRCSRRADE
jgi:hypothetical protein